VHNLNVFTVGPQIPAHTIVYNSGNINDLYQLQNLQTVRGHFAVISKPGVSNLQSLGALKNLQVGISLLLVKSFGHAAHAS
jgi:hypothetical protein